MTETSPILKKTDPEVPHSNRLSFDRWMAFVARLQIQNGLLREMLAEVLGTFILLIFGIASIAQVTLDSSSSFNSPLSIDIAWGFAVAFGVYASALISGGHLNPAVSFALAVIGKFPWRKVLPYILGQFIGSFLAAAVIHAVYYDFISSRPLEETAGIFATYKAESITIRQCFVDQLVATGMLLLCILIITDSKNIGIPLHLLPLLIGFSVATIGMTFGLNCGFPINPARDFAPRLYTYLAGWGTYVFTAGDFYWWIPIIGPTVGGVVGSVVYIGLVGFHLPPKNPYEPL